MTLPSSKCCSPIFFRYCFKFYRRKILAITLTINTYFFHLGNTLNKLSQGFCSPLVFSTITIGYHWRVFFGSCTIRQQCVSSAVHFNGGQVMALEIDESGDHQLRRVVYPIIYKVLAPSQVVGNGISANRSTL